MRPLQWGVGAGQGQSVGGHSAEAPTAADCSSTYDFLLIFRSNGKSWMPAFVPSWKALSVGCRGTTRCCLYL